MNKINQHILWVSALLMPLLVRADTASDKTVGDIIRVTWNTVIRPGIIFLFLLASVIFIWGLAQFVAKADSEEGRKEGKSRIQWGIIGMSIMIATGAIMIVLDNFFKSIK